MCNKVIMYILEFSLINNSRLSVQIILILD